jgi:PAS domain S-box-containing protein
MNDESSYQAPPTTSEYVPRFPVKTLITFVVIGICFAIAGYKYYQSEKNRFTREKASELSAIASLKKGQLETWRSERLSDANFIFRNDAIAAEARGAVQRSRGGVHAVEPPEWMKSMYKNQHYAVIALFDTAHHQVLSYPGTRIGRTRVLDSLIACAAAERRVIFSEFYADARNAPALSIVIPILIRASSAPECAGIIILQIDPTATLYPLLQSWPIPSQSGELVLLRGSPTAAWYLNSLRFRTNTALVLEEPLSDTSLLAAKAFRTSTDMIEGLDYRGAHAIGVPRQIDGTAWTLIAKNDADEVYAPLVQTGVFLRVIVVLLVLIGVVSIISVWRHRRALFYRRSYFEELEHKRAALALRESEDRFRMLVESLDEIVYTLDPSHRFLTLYGSWVERSGYDAVRLIGKTVEELFGSAGYDYHWQMEERALHGEHVLYEASYLDLATKSVRDVQTSLSPLRDSSDAIIGIVGIGRDITKVKRLERDLLQSQKMDSLGKLAGGIAHDFNNLLAMLMGSAEMLKKNLSADPVNSVHIQRILEATDRGSSIAKRLLLFSRQGAVQFQPVSISHILNEVSEMLRYTFPKTVDVIVTIEADNGIVNGDAGHLHQAFVNLCLNAKDAMGDKGTMTLSERTIDAGTIREKFPEAAARTYVAVSVTDTGAGIDPSLRGRIFEPFFTTKVNGKGTGLGLSIVDGIIRNHHGFMDVDSEPGVGTTFTVYLPAYSGSVNAPEAAREDLLGTGEKILIVDDEVFLRDILGEYLTSSGYTVLAAVDAYDALEIYEREGSSIDIVITDLGMPKMSGEELFHSLQRLNPAVAVIISSGYLDGTTRNELLGKGVIDVLTKPYRLTEIQQALFHHLRNRDGRA